VTHGITGRSPSACALGERRDNVQVHGSPIEPGLFGAGQHANTSRNRHPVAVLRGGRGAGPGGSRLQAASVGTPTPLAAFDQSGRRFAPGPVFGARPHHHQHSQRLRVPGCSRRCPSCGGGASPRRAIRSFDHTGTRARRKVHRFPRLERRRRVLRGCLLRANYEGRLGDNAPFRGVPTPTPCGTSASRRSSSESVSIVLISCEVRNPVEEMHERYPGRQCGRPAATSASPAVLLHGGRREHGEPRLPHSHHVGMVSEDRQCLRCH